MALERAMIAAAVALLIATPALGAQSMRFWNLTVATIDELYLAPAGTTKWGPNQCLNEDEKSVEADERLNLSGVEPGHYDVKLHDEKGRTCIVRNVEVKGGGKYAFSIEERELTECTR
jgi:hypothetical protein